MGVTGRWEDCLTYEVPQVEKEVLTTHDIYICACIHRLLQQQMTCHGVAPTREAAGCEVCFS